MLSYISNTWQILTAAQRAYGVGLIVLQLVTGFIEAAGIGMVFPLFQVVSSPDAIAKTPALATLHEWFGRPDPLRFVGILTVVLILFFVFKNVVVLANSFLRTAYVSYGSARIANALFIRYLAAPYSLHLERNSAELLRNIVQSSTQFFNGSIQPFFMILAEVFVVFFVGVALVIADPRSALIVLIGVGLPVLLTWGALRISLKRLGKATHELWCEIVRHLSFGFDAIKEIKIYHREVNFAGIHLRTVRSYARVASFLSVVQEIPRLVVELSVLATCLGIAWVVLGSGQILAEVVPTLGLFGAAAFRLMPSANRIAAQLNSISINAAAADQIRKDLNGLPLPPPLSPEVRTFRFRRTIDLSGIGYRYERARLPTVKEVSITIEQGTSTAFVGPSGGGKTTLINIILGLLEPERGTMTVDGRDIATPPRFWPSSVGYVPQDICIDDATLRQNIAFGLRDSEIDEARLKEAVNLSQLNALVSELPEGLDTFIGEDGARLSGGQRQRVAIARALYSNPDILVFDEATSALDAETERLITDTLNHLRGTRTLIVVAHRLSTVKNCDRIYWMADGRIDDQGTFGELAERNQGFRNMVAQMDLSDALGPRTEREVEGGQNRNRAS